MCYKNYFSIDAGSPILFQWIEKLKEIINNDAEVTEIETRLSAIQTLESEEKNREYKFENITHGTLIQDRKSVFQGHACKVTTQQDVKYDSENYFKFDFMLYYSIGILWNFY